MTGRVLKAWAMGELIEFEVTSVCGPSKILPIQLAELARTMCMLQTVVREIELKNTPATNSALTRPTFSERFWLIGPT